MVLSVSPLVFPHLFLSYRSKSVLNIVATLSRLFSLPRPEYLRWCLLFFHGELEEGRRLVSYISRYLLPRSFRSGYLLYQYFNVCTFCFIIIDLFEFSLLLSPRFTAVIVGTIAYWSLLNGRLSRQSSARCSSVMAPTELWPLYLTLTVLSPVLLSPLSAS